MSKTRPSRKRALLALGLAATQGIEAADFATKSGILTWVDPATPDDRQTYVSSRGETWTLVMSDEFNTAGRSFEPGEDHLWTSLDKPDGVNSALEVYAHNMTSTECDDDGTCYFYIEAVDQATTLKVWNDYQDPPGYKSVTFNYRSAMVQSWNKFCFQGGMVEVSAQLPGVVGSDSGNPDITSGSSARAATIKYYPTWPGIWMMGNLGRAIFSASTSRMWPFSYNECNNDVFNSTNQRINACNANPGSGMNPNQGRGAPEIDILEGAGSTISSSIQVGPGMPTDFRTIYPSADAASCIYTYTCTTKGANTPGIPKATYTATRDYDTWYQGLRYAANNNCAASAKLKQDYTTVKAALDKGVTENACTVTICPGSYDPNADLSYIDNTTTSSSSPRWGINSNGTCYAMLNPYSGAYLCSPGNPSSKCEQTNVTQSDDVPVFEYQMDAISANWAIHVAAYTSYLTYQLEWVMGDSGYVRWMLGGEPIFEIPASAITDPPQDSAKSNPKKLMLEEPMYMIFNVALSSTWGTTPPNPDGACRGDGTDATTNAICGAFPMYLKVDYIRVYQDTSANSTMAVGCDPTTHPTKEWIIDHIDEYQDDDNPATDVSGMAFCKTSDDCTIVSNSTSTSVATGTCVNSRCKCAGSSWTGPRCTSTMSSLSGTSSTDSYGPPFYVGLGTAALTVFVTFVSVYFTQLSEKKDDSMRRQKAAAVTALGGSVVRESGRKTVGQQGIGATGGARESVKSSRQESSSYSTNFV
uniref:GH16 domain-containing protein n=1 Tax=Globisporangium ultimum (strain ATCC 200006 / CBS 805.95 / DAOM BR144) TaxID=431595 RepID=K3X0G3_GLOUD